MVCKVFKKGKKDKEWKPEKVEGPIICHIFFIQGMYIDQPPAGAGIYNSTQAYL